jgi:hypothetical protein
MRRNLAVVLALVTALLIAAPAALAAPEAVQVFSQLWQRYDEPVDELVAARSWTWGRLVSPIFSGIVVQQESFAESPGGTRQVIYFDKGRMEIIDPDGVQTAQWYVTSGLLPIELMTGRMQVGYAKFEPHTPSQTTALGDPGQFPTYADLAPLYRSPGTLNPSDLGRPATGFLNPDGTITGFNDYAADLATLLVRGDNNHGVARAFVDFMHQQGLLYEDGRYVEGQLYDPLYLFGLPVTGAYWVKVRVNGVERPILFQVFERRMLTYNPANPPGWRVEMGNVGQHYYRWRYSLDEPR